MSLINNLNLSKGNFLNILLALFPVSFIAGNTIINLNIILLIISTLLFYGRKSFKLRYYTLDKLIIVFFIFVIFTGIYNDIKFYVHDLYPKGINTTIKSIFFLKYLFLYLILRFLIENTIVNLKFFFITCSFSTLFVCLDIFYQFKFGVDIFGYEPIHVRKLGGPFGDELIAGGYIQRYFLFSFFLIPLYFKNQKKFLKLIIPILFIVYLVGIILSGNRMPFVLFIFLLSLIFLFQQQVRKYFLSFLILTVVFFSLVYNSNEKVKANFNNFKSIVYSTTDLIVKRDFLNPNSPQYLKEFVTFYDTWLMNKYIGGGIKNFRWYCHHREPGLAAKKGFICNMHPHNYYLEILTETGVIGFAMVFSIFMIVLYLSFYKKYFSKSPLNDNNVIIPFIFLFIAEIFPIKSTGSFFTTGSTTYLFLILGILIAICRKNNSIENKS